MIKDIKYNGVTTVPSDYASPDGDLAQATNIAIDADGSLTPLHDGSEVTVNGQTITIAGDETLSFIHKNTGYLHYIVVKGNEDDGFLLYYIDGSTGVKTAVSDTFSTNEIYQLAAVGNTLLCLTPDGMFYFLWKEDAYVNLGNHLPEVNLQFAIEGQMVQDGDTDNGMDRIKVALDESVQAEETLSERAVTSLTTAVMAEVTKFTSQLYQGSFYRKRTGGAIDINKGKFIYPFLVRYALCLYDGTSTMHSAPVLMATTSAALDTAGNEIGHAGTPCVTWHDYDGQRAQEPSLFIEAMAYDLRYAVINSIPDEWKDIITGVNIYISQPLYDIDQSGRITEIKRGSFTPSNSKYVIDDDYGQREYHYRTYHDEQIFARRTTMFPYHYSTYTKSEGEGPDQQTTTYTIYDPVFILPKKADQKGDIKNCGAFFLLKHYNASELVTDGTFQTIDIPKDYLPSLVNREVMTDDFGSHNTMKPTIAFSYNNRINISGITRELFRGFPAKGLFQYTTTTVPVLSPKITEVFYQIYIKKDGREFVFNNTSSLYNGAVWRPLYFFYPDPDAYKVILSLTIDNNGTISEVVKKLDLSRHETLNGAVWVSDWVDSWDDRTGSRLQYWNEEIAPSPDEIPQYQLPNVVYTSEVNNPFNFSSSGANTIGTGIILGLSTATKALSEGQFGQFPLYCFTNEGVWALEVQGDGFYRATHPVSRDVCNNKDSITQIDTAVLFTTERGIMMLYGSTATCISTPLEDKAFATSRLPGLSTVAPQLTVVDFLEYLKGARMAYDYTHQRIYVFNSKQPYCYVYNLKTKKWTMQAGTYLSALNSYPDALVVQDKDNTKTLVDLSDENTEITGTGTVITRPLKLDTTALKTIRSIIQRGVFQKGHVQTILYGSRDLIGWFLLGSSTDHYLRRLAGTPYRYFRLVLQVTLDEGESLYGCTVDYEIKYNNKIR